MKKPLTLSLLTFFSTLIISTTTHAVDGLSANAAMSSNYLWRGLTQTNGAAAVSGGVDYAAESGFYIGTWASTANWSDGMTYELDIYGGFASTINDFGYDIGFVHYAYPDADNNVDFTEVNVAFSFKNFSFGYAVLADAEGVDFGDDSYIHANLDFELPSEIGLTLHIGAGTDDFYAGEKFVEYSAAFSKAGFTLNIAKNDLPGDDVKVVISYAVDIDL